MIIEKREFKEEKNTALHGLFYVGIRDQALSETKYASFGKVKLFIS